MVACKLRAVGPALSALLIMTAIWIYAPVDAGGTTLYEYMDKDGSVILTDNPPPGVKAKPFKYEEMPGEKKLEREQKPEQENNADVKPKTQPETELTPQEKKAKIGILREELEKAISDEAAYRKNMNQARGYSQRSHWRKAVDDQLKLIEEKKKQIEELERSP